MTDMMFNFDDFFKELADSRKCGMEHLSKNKPFYRYKMTNNNTNTPDDTSDNMPDGEGSDSTGNIDDFPRNHDNSVNTHAYKDENGDTCIDCDFPGRDKESIHAYWNSNRHLTIVADKCDAGKYGYYAREYAQVSFHFNHDVDYDNSTATYNNGVLTVTVKQLDKTDENKPFETPIL